MPLDSAVNIDFPYIVERFGLPIPMIQWLVISYVLTQTSLMLSFGRIGDMVGYRRVFLFGTGWSTLAFVACALAPSYPLLLIGRIAQGIGAGLILSCGPALATSLFPEAMRARVLGHYMMMFGLGGALGPAVFGLLLERFGWSAVFSFRAPVAAAAFLLAWTLPADAKAERRESFDAAGGGLLAAALSFMLLALNQSRHVLWLGLFAAASALAFGAFVRRERRIPRPIIDLSYFRNSAFTAVNVAFALVNLAGFAIMLLAPFYLSKVSGLSVPVGGLVLAVSPMGIMLAAPLAGRLTMDRAPRVVALAGMTASALGLAGVSLAGVVPDVSLLAASMFVQGFGMGLFQVAYFDIVTAAIPVRDRGVAGALGMATRSIGMVTGATVLMLVFQTLQASGGFVPAFQDTFRVAAAIPALLVVVGLVRRPRRRA
ncbi:MFS transporter [Rhodopila sp.]|uniref:MFS transporter n=1 Tax=Rhodopila sp. TaxID=2480087 RepID=UPI003D114080